MSARERSDGCMNGDVPAIRVVVYTTDWCGHCERAKTLLEIRGVEFVEERIPRSVAGRRRLAEIVSEARTFPQIVIDGHAIGGYDALVALDREGRLESLTS